MTERQQQPDTAIQRLATLTCVVALLPITIGSLVTTLKAGMAFADWPTSDGHNMLLYPWLNDLKNTDKFVEHGHRLAGMVIGLYSIILLAVALRRRASRPIQAWTMVILVAVIAQGMLGGMRVRMNEQTLAMIHSITGGLFFTLCWLFGQKVRREGKPAANENVQTGALGSFLVMALPVLVLGQYVLGGFFRHLGTMLHEHIGGAILVTIAAVSSTALLLRSGDHLLARRGRWLLAALLVQVSLGILSWITRMGFPLAGWVAVTGAPQQVLFCSLHTVGGMFLLATSVSAGVEFYHAVRTGRVSSLNTVVPEGGLT